MSSGCRKCAGVGILMAHDRLLKGAKTAFRCDQCSDVYKNRKALQIWDYGRFGRRYEVLLEDFGPKQPDMAPSQRSFHEVEQKPIILDDIFE